MRAGLARRDRGHRIGSLLLEAGARLLDLRAQPGQLFGDEVALDGDRAVELQRVERLLAQQFDIALHQLSGTGPLARQCLGLIRRGVGHAGQRGVQCLQRLRDLLGRGIALGRAGGHRQRQLCMSEPGERRLRALGRHRAAHVALVQRVGLVLQRDQIDDAADRGRRAEQVDQHERGAEPRGQRQAPQPSAGGRRRRRVRQRCVGDRRPFRCPCHGSGVHHRCDAVACRRPQAEPRPPTRPTRSEPLKHGFPPPHAAPVNGCLIVLGPMLATGCDVAVTSRHAAGLSYGGHMTVMK
ncbi:hypothetical protein [Cupriavidus gilardii]|uniref:hypothetical protein n=1 Tax=Cupriavidus gilardii TaxID=82541 RepID=UPI0031CE3F26